MKSRIESSRVDRKSSVTFRPTALKASKLPCCRGRRPGLMQGWQDIDGTNTGPAHFVPSCFIDVMILTIPGVVKIDDCQETQFSHQQQGLPIAQESASQRDFNIVVEVATRSPGRAYRHHHRSMFETTFEPSKKGEAVRSCHRSVWNASGS